MARPWRTVETVETEEGPLELRARGERDFLIVVAGRVLMTSAAHRSEEALATRALERLDRPAARLLVGGLGMGFTLRAALDALPAAARVEVVELTPAVVDWCRGPLAELTRGAVRDPRVTVRLGDVAEAIAAAPAGAYDVILLDLYEGPYHAVDPDDRWFGGAALTRARAALTPGGVLAVWSEDACPPFLRLLAGAGFDVAVHQEGRGGRSHIIYTARHAARP